VRFSECRCPLANRGAARSLRDQAPQTGRPEPQRSGKVNRVAHALAPARKTAGPPSQAAPARGIAHLPHARAECRRPFCSGRGVSCTTAEKNGLGHLVPAGRGEQFLFNVGDDVKRVGCRAYTPRTVGRSGGRVNAQPWHMRPSGVARRVLAGIRREAASSAPASTAWSRGNAIASDHAMNAVHEGLSQEDILRGSCTRSASTTPTGSRATARWAGRCSCRGRVLQPHRAPGHDRALPADPRRQSPRGDVGIPACAGLTEPSRGAASCR
jgi:hypothetical protein